MADKKYTLLSGAELITDNPEPAITRIAQGIAPKVKDRREWFALNKDEAELITLYRDSKKPKDERG